MAAPPGNAAPLPSADAMAGMVASLVVILFPHHFPTADGALLGSDAQPAHALRGSLVALEAQVRRELAIAADAGAGAGAEIVKKAHEIVGRFAEGLPATRAIALLIRYTGSARRCWRGWSRRQRIHAPGSISIPVSRSARLSSSTMEPGS